MKFQKYSPTENAGNLEIINQIKDQGLNKGLWEVSNKINGSHFSLWYDGTQLQFANQKSFIASQREAIDRFSSKKNYNFQFIRERLEGYVQRVWDLILDQISFNPPPQEIVIYGELFGRVYPGFKSEGQAIQKTPYYSPELQFYAFDLKVDQTYLETNSRLEIFNQAQVPYAPILFQGSFKECLRFISLFEDPIYQDFDLPKIEDNYSEGIIIKSCFPKFLKTGARIILRKKNYSFRPIKPKLRIQELDRFLDKSVIEQMEWLEELITED